MIATRVGVDTSRTQPDSAACARCGIVRTVRYPKAGSVCRDCREVESEILTNRIRGLWDLGHTDEQIAEAVGLSKGSVAHRRRGR